MFFPLCCCFAEVLVAAAWGVAWTVVGFSSFSSLCFFFSSVLFCFRFLLLLLKVLLSTRRVVAAGGDDDGRATVASSVLLLFFPSVQRCRLLHFLPKGVAACGEKNDELKNDDPWQCRCVCIAPSVSSFPAFFPPFSISFPLFSILFVFFSLSFLPSLGFSPSKSSPRSKTSPPRAGVESSIYRQKGEWGRRPCCCAWGVGDTRRGLQTSVALQGTPSLFSSHEGAWGFGFRQQHVGREE